MNYEVVSIPESAREDTEQLGSKPKFWVSLPDGRWLFKEARPDTGEDWAEKVAAELARHLGVRAARVELADYGALRGCISRNFIDANSGLELVHGNEILAGHVTGYDRNKTFRQADHTLDNVVAAVRALVRDDTLSTMLLTELAGYLVLDALIGNTDRHHENWGLLVKAVPAKRILRTSGQPWTASQPCEYPTSEHSSIACQTTGRASLQRNSPTKWWSRPAPY
jgi:HipA-like C-terminal domain